MATSFAVTVLAGVAALAAILFEEKSDSHEEKATLLTPLSEGALYLHAHELVNPCAAAGAVRDAALAQGRLLYVMDYVALELEAEAERTREVAERQQNACKALHDISTA
ncbi:hypothetical protein ACTJLB_09080 [Paraburkholderia sp. 22098]|uniref:hypothetical protein n=1 Tax=Paraburkholderia sp. 22098 TaxID=3453874 RepID=UPI003F86B736